MSNILKTYKECEVEKTQEVLGAGCAAVGNHLDVLAQLALQMAPYAGPIVPRDPSLVSLNHAQAGFFRSSPAK